MKRIISFLTVVLIFSVSYCSFGQTWQWASKLESTAGSNKVVVKGIDVDFSNNTYVTGYYDGQFLSAVTKTSSGQDGFVAKFDPSGTLLWVNKFGGIGNDAGNALSVETFGSGAFYITGYVQYNDPNNVSFWGTGVGTGSSLMNMPLTNTCYTAAYPNNIYLRGGISTKQIFIAKYTLNGNLLWIKPVYTSSCQDAEGLGISASYRVGAGFSVEKNVYFTGYFEGNSASFQSTAPCSFINVNGNIGNKTGFVAKINGSTGNAMWVKSLAVTNNSTAMSLGKNIHYDGAAATGFTPSGGLFVTGDYQKTANVGGTVVTTTSNNTLGFVTSLNPTNGNALWVREIESNNGNIFTRDLACEGRNNDAVYALGDYSGNTVTSNGISATNGGGRDIYLIKMTKSTGTVSIVKSEGGSEDQYGYGIEVNNNSQNIFISGGYNNSISFFGGSSFGNYGTTTNDQYMSTYDFSLNNVCATHWDASMILNTHTLDACDVAASKTDGTAYYGGLFLNVENPNFTPIPSLSTPATNPISSFVSKWQCCACPAPIISVNRTPGSSSATINITYPPCDNTSTGFRIQYVSTSTGLINEQLVIWGTSPVTISGLDPLQTYRWVSLNMCNIASQQAIIMAKKAPIEDINDAKTRAFEVFPNPAEHLIHIKTNLNGRVEIYNTLGQLVQQKQIVGSSNADMDVSEIPNGNYICKFLSEGNEVITKKIQIIH